MKAVLGTVDFLAQLLQREIGLREVVLRMSRPATRKSLLGGSLAAMRQTGELIMERGTVWNPAANR